MKSHPFISFVPVCIMSFFFACFQNFLFLFAFQQFVTDVPRSRFWIFILAGVSWASWICELMFSINLGVLSYYIFKYFFFLFLSLLVYYKSLDHMSDWLTLPHRSLRFGLLSIIFKFFFCSSNWIFFFICL